MVLRGHCERVELKAQGTHRRPPCGKKVLLDAELADTFARNTRAQLKQVFNAIRELMFTSYVSVIPENLIAILI